MNNDKINKNAKIDLGKEGCQTGELTRKHFLDFYKKVYLYFENVTLEKEYVEIENEQGIISKEWYKTKIYGTIEARAKNIGMKQSDKFEVIVLNELKNINNSINDIKADMKAMDNKFTNAIEVLDIKFINAIGEIKTEIKEIKNDIVDIKQDIKDIKSCPTVKKELKMLGK